jgi:formylmethanofuran dehydrogenase subunit E
MDELATNQIEVGKTLNMLKDNGYSETHCDKCREVDDVEEMVILGDQIFCRECWDKR